MGGQRQILSNQIEGSRKFNGIFREKKIAAQAQDVGEYFNTPIWSTGAEKTHISDHSTNTKVKPFLRKFSQRILRVPIFDREGVEAWKDGMPEKVKVRS